ncbi:MAG TPA: tetratricopeptide repeat protein [Thermoanaerobaculia bacterium]
MTGYSAKEIGRLLGMSPGELRGYVRAGFLSPERGEKGELLFSFQDLVFLRTARGLSEARLPPRRIRRAFSRLREQLPEGRPLTAVRLAVEGNRIVAEDGARRWQPESGQILLDFGTAPADAASPATMPVPVPAVPREDSGPEFSAEQWFELACELEASSSEEAIAAYRKALALDAAHADAHVNLGRLLHEAGDAGEAATHYEAALEARPDDAVAAYNLGVAEEDLNRLPEALLAYQKAVRLDPENADAHFNAAALAERLGRHAEALQHLKSYRKLTKG